MRSLVTDAQGSFLKDTMLKMEKISGKLARFNVLAHFYALPSHKYVFGIISLGLLSVDAYYFFLKKRKRDGQTCLLSLFFTCGDSRQVK